MRVESINSPELHHPGWQTTDWRGYEYAIFAPESGTGRWQTQWRDAESEDGGLVTSEDLDTVLTVLPLRVAVAFRQEVGEHLSEIETGDDDDVATRSAIVT